MNVESITAIFGACVPLVSGVVGYIMHTLDKRISSLELTKDRLQEAKLDKEDYYRDQGVMRSSLTRIEDNVANLPEKILNLFKAAGTN